MTVRHAVAANTTNTTITTTTETVLCTLNGVSTRDGSEMVTLIGNAFVTWGTGATSATLRVRRGTDTTGTLIGEANAVTITAGNESEVTIEVEDNPGEVAAQSYVLTVAQAAATGNGTGAYAALEATIGA